jgi:hypothetical protein
MGPNSASETAKFGFNLHDAQGEVQRYLGEIVQNWLQHHPEGKAACCLESEEHYVALTFERFWRLTLDQRLACTTLTTALY